jgi:hypothetical protein
MESRFQHEESMTSKTQMILTIPVILALTVTVLNCILTEGVLP